MFNSRVSMSYEALLRASVQLFIKLEIWIKSMTFFKTPNELAASIPSTLALGKPRFKKSTQADQKWQTLFKLLPSELHINITAHLDPVSQMCLGLTNAYFHIMFHEVVGVLNRCAATREYNIKRYPFNLRMQASICGEHVRNGWTEFHFLEDDPDMAWSRNLDQLLVGERALWRGVKRCGGCLVYRPRSAWGRIGLEEVLARRYGREIDAVEGVDVLWYLSQCRRCRVKVLLVALEGKREFFKERECILEDEPSVGLVISGGKERDAVGFELNSYEGRLQKYGGSDSNVEHETWENIFEKLEI